jgi:hypothetical protein
MQRSLIIKHLPIFGELFLPKRHGNATCGSKILLFTIPDFCPQGKNLEW